MSNNYSSINYLNNSATVAVGASATNSTVINKIAISAEDSLNFKLRLVCSAAVKATGITWKLQHSWDDGSTWEDVSRGGSVATATVYGVAVADADVTSGTEKITAAAHSFETGDAIYYKSSSTNPITGLTTDTVYYAIDSGTNDFQVASTLALALAGTPINLTQPAGGDTHRFTRLNSELALNVENTTDEAVLPLHPLVRVVATTGANDVFTVAEAWHNHRES